MLPFHLADEARGIICKTTNFKTTRRLLSAVTSTAHRWHAAVTHCHVVEKEKLKTAICVRLCCKSLFLNPMPSGGGEWRSNEQHRASQVQIGLCGNVFAKIEQKGASCTVKITLSTKTQRFQKAHRDMLRLKGKKNILLTIKLIIIITFQYSNCYLFFKMAAFLIRTVIIMTFCWRAADILKKYIYIYEAEIHGCQTSIITF